MSLKSVLLVVALLQLSGCGLITRSSEATNVEDDKAPLSENDDTIEPPDADDVAPPPARPRTKPSQVQNGSGGPVFSDPTENVGHPPQKAPGVPKLANAELFNQALKEQTEGAFLAAGEHWKKYLDQYPGLPGYEQAQYNYGITLFHLGRPEESIRTLSSLVESTRDAALAIDARIVMAEALIQSSQYDEALALTFELLPDTKAEKRTGLTRDSDAVGISNAGGRPNLVQKIRLLTLRGRIYASLNNEEAAQAALSQAQTLLESSQKGQLSRKDRRLLSAQWAWRQLEVKALSCRNHVKTPEALSEAEFLAYADAYYGCAAQAQQLFCQVLAAKDQQVRNQALETYRKLVEAPLELKDHLPPPARDVRKQEQRPYYEREMKALIEKTVHERSAAFRNISSCGAYDLF